MHAKRFEELKATGLLPSPTGVGLEIVRLTRDDKTTAIDLARVIQADPALAGRTLRLANTGNTAASRPVTNITDAVARLGMRTVSAVALGFTILAGNRSGKCKQFDYARYWAHSLANAIAAQILCQQTHKFAGADGFTAGLLAQVGRLALASVHSEKYAIVLTEWGERSPADLVRIEQRNFVTDHNELSAAMLEDWGLPKFLVDAVLHQENPSAGELNEQSQARLMARMLHATSRIADICVAPSEQHAVALACDLLARCEPMGLGSDTIVALFERVFEQWNEWGSLLEVPTAKTPKLAELMAAAKSADLSILAPVAPASPALENAPAAPIPAVSTAPPAVSLSPSPHSAAETPSAAVSRVGAQAGADEPVVENPDAPQGLMVLVADPNAASRQFLEKFLVLSGHRVRCASAGREALRAFLDTAPQLVVVDAGLPEIDGLELCRNLRKTVAGRQAYIIVLISPDDEETMIRLFEAGADDFVTKPFAARPFFARIRASLRVIGLQGKIDQNRDELQRIHSDLTVAHRRLEQDALTDVLTGLPNRRYLIDRLAHEWAAARRSGTPLCCMMIDIDRFKSVNDNYGHDVGDLVLQSVADVLQHEIRGTEVVCRYGGEEFVHVSAIDFESALRCAERLRTAVKERVHQSVKPLNKPVTVSIGVAARNQRTGSVEALLKAADEALFAAKRGGRDLVAGSRDSSTASADPAGNFIASATVP